MKLEHVRADWLKAEIKKILAGHLDLQEYRIFFFGSRVRGDTDDRADIDIGISGARRVDAAALASIREEVDLLPILYSFDVVDFKGAGAEFEATALKNIEPIN